MSTSHATGSNERNGAGLNVLRCGFTGGVVAATLFVVCWVTGVLGLLAGSHTILATVGGVTLMSLGVGLLCSIAAGALVGMLIAAVYNASAFVSRR
jgi:hypothetical protein